VGTNAATFPEWKRARQDARPEDDWQKRLVQLLEQPIDASETQKLTVRKKQLQDLVDGAPQPSAERMRQRLTDPKDSLGQFMAFELSTALRDDLVQRLADRDKLGSRSTSQQNRSTVPPPEPQKDTQQQHRSTGPSQQGPGGGLPFMFLPPVIIEWPGIVSPQYFPNGFPPAGIYMRPVLLIPQTYPPAPTQKKPPPPPKPKPKDKDKDKDGDKGKPKKKQPELPPTKRGPSIIDWLADHLTHWSLDFVSDQLTDGHRFRILTVVDDCTREWLALVADTSLSGTRVARELDRLVIRARQAQDGGQRQRHRTHQQRHPDMGRSEPRRLALHRARQAHAECLHRELQRPAAG
jgi:hypothetical protein